MIASIGCLSGFISMRRGGEGVYTWLDVAQLRFRSAAIMNVPSSRRKMIRSSLFWKYTVQQEEEEKEKKKLDSRASTIFEK